MSSDNDNNSCSCSCTFPLEFDANNRVRLDCMEGKVGSFILLFWACDDDEATTSAFSVSMNKSNFSVRRLSCVFGADGTQKFEILCDPISGVPYVCLLGTAGDAHFKCKMIG